MLVQGEGHFSSMTGYSSGCLNTVETWEHVLLYLEYCWRGGSLKYSGWILPWRQTASLSGCFVSWGGSATFQEQIFYLLLYKYYSVDVYQIISGLDKTGVCWDCAYVFVLSLRVRAFLGVKENTLMQWSFTMVLSLWHIRSVFRTYCVAMMLLFLVLCWCWEISVVETRQLAIVCIVDWGTVQILEPYMLRGFWWFNLGNSVCHTCWLVSG